MGAEPDESKMYFTISALIEMNSLKFGGKNKGRYRISRRNLMKLSGQPFLSERIIGEIQETLRGEGFHFIEIGEAFIVIKSRLFKNYRRAGPSVINRFIED